MILVINIQKPSKLNSTMFKRLEILHIVKKKMFCKTLTILCYGFNNVALRESFRMKMSQVTVATNDVRDAALEKRGYLNEKAKRY